MANISVQEQLNKLLEAYRAKLAEYAELTGSYTTERYQGFQTHQTERYLRVCWADGSILCFVVLADFSNKALGIVKAGDILMPSTFTAPAKGARGNIFDEDTWFKALLPGGVKYSRGYQREWLTDNQKAYYRNEKRRGVQQEGDPLKLDQTGG